MSRAADLDDDRPRSEWGAIVIRSVLALGVLAGVYVGAAYYLGERVPNGTTVEGVRIGNLTPETALDTLGRQLAPLTEEPVVIEADGEELLLDPGAAGLGLDLEETLEGVAGVTFHPGRLWDRVTDNGEALPLQVDVDAAALQRALEEEAAEFDEEAEEGRVRLERGSVERVDPVPGRRLHVPGTAQALSAGWPHQRTVAGVVEPVPAAVTAAEIERFVTAEAEPALAAPVTVEAGEEEMTLSPNQLSRLLTVEATEEHALRLVLDEVALLEVVRSGLTEVVEAPRDAAVRLGEDGRPEILPARTGTELDEDSVIAGVSAAIDSADDRTATVRLNDVSPDVTAQQAEAWDVDQVLAEFRSAFPTGPASAARTENIRVGLAHVNGTVVMPGEQFSLGETLAPISEDRGYVKAGVIVNGRLAQGMGGGLSQVSTAVLNTAWFAGVQLDEFQPHSYYIPRYPVGREATISIPQIDNRWTNDTDSPVVVQSWIEGAEIVMRFWGDRQYTVQTITGERRNILEPGQGTDDSPDCLPQRPQEGFDITVTRVLTRGGEEVSRESYTTRYHPSDEVTCTDPAAGR